MTRHRIILSALGVLFSLGVYSCASPPEVSPPPPPDEAFTSPVVILTAPADGRGVTYLDIKAWEAHHGRIPNGAIVLLRADETNAGDGEPTDTSGGAAHFSAQAIEYLATWRDPAVVGAPAATSLPGAADGDDEAIDDFIMLTGLGPFRGVSATGRRGRLTRDWVEIGPRLFPDAKSETIPGAGEKLLIEFGWDIPNEKTLAQAARAGTPFDGAVFEPHAAISGRQLESLTWMVWGDRMISDAEVTRIVQDLAATPPAFRAHSFLRFNVTPGHVDWFDDNAAILHNAKAAATICREAGLAGILFDVEQYEGRIWEYARRPPGRTFDEYEAQTRTRGEEFVAAIAAAHPSIGILMTFGYSLADRDREHAQYGLLPAFLDGMLSAQPERMTIIDGYEYAYPFKEREAFARGRAEVLRDSGNRLAVGFGLWLDWNSGTYGWHPDDHAANWFSPEEFRAAVSHALDLADRYVWIYTERLNWWTGEDLPAAYVQAVEEAKVGPR